MSCKLPQTDDSSMSIPASNFPSTSPEFVDLLVELIEKYAASQQNTSDPYASILYIVHARLLRALQQYQPRVDEQTRVGRRRKDVEVTIDEAIYIAAMRAAALCDDTMEYYEAGWRLEISKRSSGGEYARFRRSTGSGKRETKYIGVIKQSKRKK